MSTIDKRALRKAAMHAKTTADWGCDADNFHDKATPDVVLALLDELEAKDKRIAELEASHGKLREEMASIHNTIRGEGAYTPLAAILNASKRAYEESAAAAGKGEAS